MLKLFLAVAVLATLGWFLADELPFGENGASPVRGPSVQYPGLEQQTGGPVGEVGSETAELLD